MHEGEGGKSYEGTKGQYTLDEVKEKLITQSNTIG